MPMSMIENIVNAIQPQESMSLQISNDEKNGVAIILTPNIGETKESDPKEVQSIRAALAMPLVVRGATAEEATTAFNQRVEKYAEARGEARGALDDLLLAIGEATKQAKADTDKQKKKADKAKPKATATEDKGEKPAEKPDDKPQEPTKAEPKAEAPKAEEKPANEPKPEPADANDLFAS